MNIILIILLFVMLIFPHELGHFIVAKLCKVQVNEFALGMGPCLIQKKKGETLYSLRLIPVGGYCQMEGEDTKENTGNPRAFNNKKWWQKILVLLAGATMNVLIAFFVLTFAIGISGYGTNKIDKVMPNSPASIAQLETGDVITKIDDKKIEELSDIQKAMQGQASKSITVSRDGNTFVKEIKPKLDKKTGVYLVGITTSVDRNIITVIGKGTKATFSMMGNMIKSVKSLFTSKDAIKNVSGPVAIISIVNTAANQGASYYLYLLALISLNLAIFNLLPLPALDGGRIIFVIIRKITGKVITDKIESRVHLVGMLLLISLMIFVTFQDIMRLF